MVAKAYTVRLHEKGQALMDSVTKCTGFSQSDVVAIALEVYAKQVYTTLLDQATDGSADEEETKRIRERIKPLKTAIGIIGK